MESDGSKERHAIVIGGSISGMVTAAVLAERFERVTLIERDTFPGDPQDRAGLPQGRHAHLLLAQGRRLLDTIFPQLSADLLAAGAIEFDPMGESVALFASGWMPRSASPLRTFAASRALLDWVVRQQLLRLPNVILRDQTDVIGLIGQPAQPAISGVRLRSRTGDHAESELAASLVVDASGRSSKAPEWLQALGYAAPEETRINSFLGYASAMYRMPPGWQPDWKMLLIGSQPPDNPRGAVIFPIEGERWIVTLGGAARDYPPLDEAGFMEFVRSLRTPLLYEVLSQGELISPISGYQRTENRLLHFEKLERLPERFIAIGDAVCGFNPIYGQGMTAASMGALLLRDYLRKAPDPGALGWSAEFQKRLARQNQPIWMMATGEDFRYPTTEGGQRTAATRLTHWYFDQFNLQIPQDVEAAKAFVEVMHLTKRPTVLFHPRFLGRMVANLVRPTASAPLGAAPDQAASVGDNSP